jgi:hypothetical protein
MSFFEERLVEPRAFASAGLFNEAVLSLKTRAKEVDENAQTNMGHRIRDRVSNGFQDEEKRAN